MIDSINNSKTQASPVTNAQLNATATSQSITSTLSTEQDLLIPALNSTNPPLNNQVRSTASPAVTLQVSKASQEKAAQDLAIAKLVRKANTVKEAYNQEKVDHFKQLAQNPQALTQYLNNLDTQAIATTILSNTEGQFFS
jgi:hypothetical protein